MALKSRNPLKPSYVLQRELQAIQPLSERIIKRWGCDGPHNCKQQTASGHRSESSHAFGKGSKVSAVLTEIKSPVSLYLSQKLQGKGPTLQPLPLAKRQAIPLPKCQRRSRLTLSSSCEHLRTICFEVDLACSSFETMHHHARDDHSCDEHIFTLGSCVCVA